MRGYHITVLQLLRMKLVCSHFFLFKLVCSLFFFFFCSLARKSSFSSLIILSVWNLTQNLAFAIACKKIAYREKNIRYMEGRKGGKGEKKKTKSLLRVSNLLLQTNMNKISLKCGQFLSRKQIFLSQYCRGFFVFSTAPVTAKLWTHERKKQFPTLF